MQSEAYKITGFTAVVSALGFLLRWLQNMQIMEPDTGLATPGKGISFVVAGLIVLMAVVLGALTFGRKNYTAPVEPEKALAGKTFLYTALGILPAVLYAAAGAVMLLGAWPESQEGAFRVCGGAALAAAAGTVLVAGGIRASEKAPQRRIGSVLLILFGGLWLIAEYKSAAADPVIWRFAVDILAICAALLAWYYVAGYFYGEPSPRMAVFFCGMGAFLCVMSAVDEHTLGESLCFAAAALQLFIWGYALTANFRRGTEPEPEEEHPDENVDL